MIKNVKLQVISNYVLTIYLLIWIYYAVFNWDVFAIQLNTNAGFSVIKGYPLAFFFLLGFAAILILKYFIQLNATETEKQNKDKNHKIAMQEKDIELLKMKEVLFKMQTSEMGKNSSHLDALHKKLDSLSDHIAREKDTDTTNNQEKEDKEQ